jgi:hypothetical protein
MSDFFTDLLDEATAQRHLSQGTDQWAEIRLGRFTSSEIWKLIVEPKEKAKQEAGLLSETAMTYVQDKVAEVMTGQAKSQGYAFPLVYGKETEPLAIEEFIKRTGFKYEAVGFYEFTDHAGGSPDGLINDSDILEVKCPVDSSKMIDYLLLTDQYDLKRMFREYYWQMQGNMLFSKTENGHFVAYDPRMVNDKHRIVHIEVKADKKDQDILIYKIARATEEKLKLLSLFK